MPFSWWRRKAAPSTIEQIDIARWNFLLGEALNLHPNREFRLEFATQYINAASQDLETLIGKLHQTSRPDASTMQVAFEHSISSSLVFEASVGLNKSSKPRIQFSTGLLLALDDLFLRLCCNRNFFGRDYHLESKSTDNRVWDGCECLWPTRAKGYRPAMRYYDYTHEPTVHHPNQQSEETILSVFNSGFPYGDRERLNLAMGMVQIAVLWILMHEEAHYFNGHVHYFRQSWRVTGREAPSQFDETSGRTHETFSRLHHQTLEWQADRSATYATLDVALRQEGLIGCLPKYCRESPRWVLRYILTAIGCIQLLFHKARLSAKSEGAYPSCRTRLASALFGARSKLYIKKHLKPKNIRFRFSEMDYVNAVCGTLFDLAAAEEAAACDSESAEPAAPGAHSLCFVDGEENVEEICAAMLNPDSASRQVDALWLEELRKLVEVHETELFAKLKPFREMSGNPL
jgi:hypothetical protein